VRGRPTIPDTSKMSGDIDRTMCSAAERGDVAEIERLIAAGANPNAFEGTRRMTALQYAAFHGHLAAIAALLAAGAHVDGAGSAGYTPLMYAAMRNKPDAIAALIAVGANVNHARRDSDTALHVASCEGHLCGARALLEAGARTDVRTRFGRRPIEMVRDTMPVMPLVKGARAFAIPLLSAALDVGTCADFWFGVQRVH